jgi:hypothetical protein
MCTVAAYPSVLLLSCTCCCLPCLVVLAVRLNNKGTDVVAHLLSLIFNGTYLVLTVIKGESPEAVSNFSEAGKSIVTAVMRFEVLMVASIKMTVF